MTQLFRMKLSPIAFVFVSLSFPLLISAASLHEKIDQQIAEAAPKWKVDQMPGISSDAEFVRRVYLDFTGDIPSAQVASRFIRNSDPDKRAKLIDELLASDEFVRRMAVVFDVMLMERRADSRVTTDEWRAYLESSIGENRPLDSLAAEILAGGGIEEHDRPAAKFYLDRAIDKDALVRDTGRLFLGMDLQCAQCHDHPTIDDWKHEHYFGLNAFFAGIQQGKLESGKFAVQEIFAPDVEFVSVFEPDVTRTTGPRIPFGNELERPSFPEGEEYVDKEWKKKRQRPELKFSTRQLLAKELTGPQTDAFSRNLANRIWGILMGRGIVHPYDMDHSDNPPSHPELLDLLSTELRTMKFDLRAFMRELALSETYQRSSEAPAGVDPNSIPPESFALANAKGLSPEQLFASLLTATGSEPVLQSQLAAAVKEDADDFAELEEDEEKMSEAIKGQRKKRVAEFVSAFASTPGRPEGDFQASLPQALFLANHEGLVEWLEPRDENLASWLLARDEPGVVSEAAYLAILTRLPTNEEVALTEQHFQARAYDRPRAVTELIWSLVASAEFRLNH